MTRPPRVRAFWSIVLLLASTLAGCATSVPRAPVGALMAGDIATVRGFYDRELREGDVANGALFLNGLAQMEMLAGKLDRARRLFLQAGRIMGNWQTSGAEAFGAIVGSESSKTWKGDPYEKAMNAYYTGMLYWIAGQPDNARAAFKKGILADAESEEGTPFQVDFALLYWLAGRASLAMGLRDDAEGYFEEARKARAFAVQHGAAGEARPGILTEPAAGNLLCLVDLGLGPRKVRRGSQGELAVIEAARPQAKGAELFLNGRSLGRTELLGDVVYQASTRGGTAMEGIREGKAVLKTATGVAGVVLLGQGIKSSGAGQRDLMLVGAGLLALSLLVSSAADVRSWETLPETVHALAADVPPGVHQVRIEFFAAGGRRLPNLTQTWTIEIPESGESLYYFRSLPGLDRRTREVSQ